jgi:hypothetical protein
LLDRENEARESFWTHCICSFDGNKQELDWNIEDVRRRIMVVSARAQQADEPGLRDEQKIHERSLQDCLRKLERFRQKLAE